MTDDHPHRGRRSVLSVLAGLFGILLGANSYSDVATAVKSPLSTKTTTTTTTTTDGDDDDDEETTTTTTEEETTTTTTDDEGPRDPEGTFVMGSVSTEPPHPLRAGTTVSASLIDVYEESKTITTEVFLDNELVHVFEFDLDPGDTDTKSEEFEFSKPGEHVIELCSDHGCHEHSVSIPQKDDEGKGNEEDDEEEEEDHVTDG